jgi:hypothetical protein
MFKNRFLLMVGLLAVLLATMAISRPSSSAPTRPVVLPVTGASEYLDYHQRHPKLDVEEAQPYVMDSATRSYIARGEALEAAGKLRNSGACSYTNQENIFVGIPDNLDSATRSYIAWGLALQAKDDIRASCREVTVDSAESNSPIDECVDVSISELAACNEASQSAAE